MSDLLAALNEIKKQKPTGYWSDRILAELETFNHAQTDIFVLPPFTALPAAKAAFSESPVAIGGQNMAHLRQLFFGRILSPAVKASLTILA